MVHTASASTVEVAPASFKQGAKTPSSVVPDILDVGRSPAALEGYIRFFLNEMARDEGAPTTRR